jgi:nucleoside-diphosphate-sugar epimerase
MGGLRPERPLPAEDLDFIVREAAGVWPLLRDARIFITGGTGFFGRWLLESLFAANERQSLGVRVVALSREPDRFLESVPHLAIPGLGWIKGSVATLNPDALDGERFDMVIHMATEADMQASTANPQGASDVITGGTERALDVAARTGARRFLFTSSGAVYGTQPADMDRIAEDYTGVPDPLDRNSLYALPAVAKRRAELLCVERAERRGLGALIARGFTFAGPGLPMGGKFAFGNFMRDALAGGPIVIKGDGTTLRSYLYGADLAVWLWTLLLQGKSGRAYNVGSEDAVSLRRLAEAVAEEFGVREIEVRGHAVPGAVPERYVPSTRRARQELGLGENFSLPEIIRRTAAWHRAQVQH